MATPTWQETQSAYLENADYEEANDAPKARAFQTACRRLLAFAAQSGKSDNTIRFDLAQVQQQLAEVGGWLASAPAANSIDNPSVLFSWFAGYRH